MNGKRWMAARTAAASHDEPRQPRPAPATGAYGTLVLDGIGRIRSCGTEARQMLGRSLAELLGKPVSAFVADFSLGKSPADPGARDFAAVGDWHKFEAVDGSGHGFAVELSLARVMTDGQDLFLLNMRRPYRA